MSFPKRPKVTLNGVASDLSSKFVTYEDVVDACECGRSKDALHTVVVHIMRPCTRISGGAGGSLAPGEGMFLCGHVPGEPCRTEVHISAVVTDGA